MFIQYGTISLRVVDINTFDRVNVYSDDGVDLLYVKVTLGVTAVYAPGGNPAMPSITFLSRETADIISGFDTTLGTLRTIPQGVGPGAPGLGAGATAFLANPPLMETDPLVIPPVPPRQQFAGPQTDAEIRWRLMVPRQPLILFAWDRQTGMPIQWLTSPRPGFPVDVCNGPKPISCDVVAVAGEPDSIGVHYQIQTWMLPCPEGSDRFILSHRWTMSHTHDEDNYLTRVVQGKIVFNGAYIAAFGVRPEWVLNQMIHPIPLGYRRHVPQVTQSSDGLVIDYTIEDTDPTIIFEPADSGAVGIDIVEDFAYTSPAISAETGFIGSRLLGRLSSGRNR